MSSTPTVTPTVRDEPPQEIEIQVPSNNPRLGHLNWENFHALLIGIDEYPPEVGSLRGAVRDMEIMANFLGAAFDIPSDSHLDIRYLKNKEATHSNIINEIRKLENDNSVKMNDAILIYYSGHGASMPPPKGWPGHGTTPPGGKWPKGVEIQCIVASDAAVSQENRNYFASGVVLDRTLAALLHDLADKKGSNITVILDCCHSGSGTRDETDLVRGIEFRDPDGKLITVPGDYDKAVWNKYIDSNRGAVIDYKYRHAGLGSHVLLAACGSDEKASDGYSFTQALIEYLGTASLRALSYVALIKNIDPKNRLTQQRPICEGNGKNSMLFDLKEVNVGRPTFDVLKGEKDLILCAGSILGVAPGTTFSVYTSKVFSIKSTLIGNFTVKSVGTTTSTLNCLQAEFESMEHDTAVASPIAHSESQFSVCITDESIRSCVEDAIKQENPEDQYGRPQLILAADGSTNNVDLTLGFNGGEIGFFYPPQSKVGKRGLERLHFTFPKDPSRTRRVLRSVAHFFEHLNREPQNSILQNGVEVHLCELEESNEYTILAGKIRRVLSVKRRLTIKEHGAYEVQAAKAGAALNTAPAYGIEIVNKNGFELFAWAFFFDCSTLEIRSYYEPPVAKGNTVVDATLPGYAKGEPTPVALNFRNGGGQPLKLQLYDQQTLDIGFLRIFLSTQYLGGGLSSIAQDPPLIHIDGSWRGNARKSRPYNGGQSGPVPKGPDDTWGVITIPLVQRAVRIEQPDEN